MKLLIAGAGFIVSDFLTITKDLKNTELVGITGTTSDLEHMKEYQEKYGIEKIYTDYDQALKETSADTVYIAVPNFLHYSFAKKALLAGKNVICEKPFTVKYDEFKELKQFVSYVDRLRNVYDEKIEADPKDQEMYENMRNRMDMMRDRMGDDDFDEMMRRCRHMDMEMPFGMMHHMCGRHHGYDNDDFGGCC